MGIPCSDGFDKAVCSAVRDAWVVIEAVVGWKGLSGGAGGRSRRRTGAGIVGVREVAAMNWRHWCVDYKTIEDTCRRDGIGINGRDHRPGFIAVRVGIWVLYEEHLFHSAALWGHLYGRRLGQRETRDGATRRRRGGRWGACSADERSGRWER